MTPPAALQPLLATPPEGCSSLRLDHRRRTRFRWMVLVELALGTLLTFCLLPLLLLGATLLSLLVPESPVGLDELLSRATRREHLLRLEALDAQGRRLARAEATSGSEDQAHATLLAALERARAGDLQVEERVEGAPLMRWPTPEEPAPELLEGRGLRAKREGQSLRVEVNKPALPWWLACALMPALAPFLLLSASGRGRLAELADDARRRPPARVVLSATPEGLEVWEQRGEDRRWSARWPSEELLGLAWGPWLGHGEGVASLNARLHVLGARERRRLHLAVDAARGQTLAAALRATISLQQEL